MNARLITREKVWPAITRAARSRPRTALVATPYFGQSGAKLLPLGNGARLVVDASEHAVKNGQTCPKALLTLHRRGVRVYDCAGLHAKVYVFGTKAYVGSANASSHSKYGLIEAVIETTQRTTVGAAREFVTALCSDHVPLGEDELSRLAGIYREPRRSGARVGARRKRARKPKTWIAHVWEDELPETAEDEFEEGERKARRDRSVRKHVIESIWDSQDPRYQCTDTIVEVFHDQSGRVMVIPPGRVVLRKKWRGGRRRLTFIYYERPPGRRISLSRLAKKLGRGSKLRLEKDGLLRADDFRTKLLGYFDKRK